jgi:hypothetical protein
VLGIDGCLVRLMGIPGTRRVTLVDAASGQALTSAGADGPLGARERAAAASEVVRDVLASPAPQAVPPPHGDGTACPPTQDIYGRARSPIGDSEPRAGRSRLSFDKET